MSLFVKGFIMWFVSFEVLKIINFESDVFVRFSDSNPLTNPGNFSMSENNFEIAVKPVIRIDTEKDIKRYLKIIFGAESFQW
jgi:hypothetical protein